MNKVAVENIPSALCMDAGVQCEVLRPNSPITSESELETVLDTSSYSLSQDDSR